MKPQRKYVGRSEPSAAVPAAVATAAATPRISGARILQDRARAYAAGDLDGRPARWSKRRTLLFAVGASLALWSGIFAVGWAIIRSFA